MYVDLCVCVCVRMRIGVCHTVRLRDWLQLRDQDVHGCRHVPGCAASQRADMPQWNPPSTLYLLLHGLPVQLLHTLEQLQYVCGRDVTPSITHRAQSAYAARTVAAKFTFTICSCYLWQKIGCFPRYQVTI